MEYSTMKRPMGVVEEITGILTEFALTKFPVEALEVKGPVHEGAKYRWRIVSTRYKDVTIVLQTSKLPFLKRGLRAIQVFGTSQDRELRPNLDDLRAYLLGAELVPEPF
jgi:hypothetical protein